MACFDDINFSQGSVATYSRRSGIFDIENTLSVSKKQDTTLLFITSPNVNLFSKVFFAVRPSGKFEIKPCLNMPPHLKRVDTLPCEISMF